MQHHGQWLFQYDHGWHLSTDQTKTWASLRVIFLYLYFCLSGISQTIFCKHPFKYSEFWILPSKPMLSPSSSSRSCWSIQSCFVSVCYDSVLLLLPLPSLTVCFSFHLLGLPHPPPRHPTLPIPSQLLPAVVRLIQTSTALPTAAYRSTERQGGGEEKEEGARGVVLCSHPSHSSFFLPSKQQWVRQNETDGGAVMSAPSDRTFQQGIETGRNSASVKHAGWSTYFL